MRRLVSRSAFVIAVAASLSMAAACWAQSDEPKDAGASKPAQPTNQDATGSNDAKPQVRPQGHRPPPPSTVRKGSSRGAVIPEPTVILEPGQVPVIEFDTPTYDFGRVRSGQEVGHDFWFNNTGNGPLEILRVKTSCGCTTAGEYTKIIAPGESGRIPIRLSTVNRTGRQSKSVTVYTNEPERTQIPITLTVKGVLWEPVESAPQAASFGKLRLTDVGAPKTVRVIVTNHMDTPADLTELSIDSPHFQARKTVLEPGKRFAIDVSLVPGVDIGSFRAQLTMKTGVPERPTLAIPVHLAVVGALDLLPQQVQLMPYRTAVTTSTVKVVNNMDEPLKISDVAVTNPAIQVSMREDVPGKLISFALQVPADYTPEPGDELTFKTNAADQPVVSVPILQRNLPIGRKGQPEIIGGPIIARPGTIRPSEKQPTGEPGAKPSDGSLE